MSYERRQQLIIMINLCSSIVEGAEYLISHPLSKRLKEDTLTGLCSLRDSLIEFCVDPWLVYATRWLQESVKKEMFVYEQEFRNMLYHWYCLALKELKQLLEEEISKCPVCGQKGELAYFALFYDENKSRIKDGTILEPVRAWLRCPDCKSVYLTQDKLEDMMAERTENVRSLHAKCRRISDAARERGKAYSNGGRGETDRNIPVLFVGDEESLLFRFVNKQWNCVYATLLQGFEDMEEVRQEDAGKIEKFHIILFENLSDSINLKTVLKNAAQYLEDDGFIWFEITDLESAFKGLADKGKPLWDTPAFEISVPPDRMKRLIGECGLKIKSYKRIRSSNARMEYIAVKNFTENRPFHGQKTI